MQDTLMTDERLKLSCRFAFQEIWKFIDSLLTIEQSGHIIHLAFFFCCNAYICYWHIKVIHVRIVHLNDMILGLLSGEKKKLTHGKKCVCFSILELHVI